ncbi:LacI family DNA-binding transcriptional regulator [Deinococcus hopiensis]|uniref:Transcriptional regulator, LacI family n=1 Tax=Deinococcus hopiensis KR-140 TaxID=695939 RepID=A0A1W1UL06_9DEIO|nr:LacI family DNA-binding transcriptional regulator [Deinococcus hopiensis]SMB81481.1 transcriptional regulator, LacI family [Deinococcus hopiensis KR-140]
MSSTRKPATLEDVARLAGVSHITVSRVVNNYAHISLKTREKVEAAIRELGYVPNRLAQGLARHRTHTIGFATNDISLHAPSQLASGIERAAREHGYSLIVSIVHDYGLPAVEGAVRALRERHVDGVLVNASLNSRDMLSLLEGCGDVPCVFLDAPAGVEVHAALLDQYAGAQLGAEHLLNLGHTRIALVCEPQPAEAEHSRSQGWLDALAARGLKPVATAHGDWSARSGYEAATTLLGSGTEFTGLLIANDQMAVGVLRALWERGLNVPRDVSVVGFDDTAESAMLIPPLTTIRQDFPNLGQRAFHHLVQLLEGKAPPQPTMTTPELIERSSTAPPYSQMVQFQDLMNAVRQLSEQLRTSPSPKT